ncbi:MAG: hypothetical protein MUC34_12460, partial [Anaerolineae bacterium]|nr:hypothetical protein [Anaerolineae bacterium]
MAFASALIAFLLALSSLSAGACPDAEQPGELRVFVADPPAAFRDAIEVMPGARVEDPSAATAIILNGVLDDGALMREQAERGATVVLALGPDVTAEELSRLLGKPVTLTLRPDSISLATARGSDDPAAK